MPTKIITLSERRASIRTLEPGAARDSRSRSLIRAILVTAGVLSGIVMLFVMGQLFGAHSIELEPAEFYAVNDCDVPIRAVGGPTESYYTIGVSGPPIEPGEIPSWRARFDLEGIDADGPFYIWVVPVSASDWGSPREIEFSDLRHEVTETGLDVFYFEITGDMCLDAYDVPTES